jgi:hypothetical protein
MVDYLNHSNYSNYSNYSINEFNFTNNLNNTNSTFSDEYDDNNIFKYLGFIIVGGILVGPAIIVLISSIILSILKIIFGKGISKFLNNISTHIDNPHILCSLKYYINCFNKFFYIKFCYFCCCHLRNKNYDDYMDSFDNISFDDFYNKSFTLCKDEEIIDNNANSESNINTNSDSDSDSDMEREMSYLNNANRNVNNNRNNRNNNRIYAHQSYYHSDYSSDSDSDNDVILSNKNIFEDFIDKFTLKSQESQKLQESEESEEFNKSNNTIDNETNEDFNLFDTQCCICTELLSKNINDNDDDINKIDNKINDDNCKEKNNKSDIQNQNNSRKNKIKYFSDKVIKTKCGHYYHFNCLKKYYEYSYNNRNCPLCKKKIEIETIISLFDI